MRSLKHILMTGTLVTLLLAVCSPVSALTIMAGSDYLQTAPGTFINFDPFFPGLGNIDFLGDPIGPSSTDTIVQRKDDAVLPGAGSTATIEIEIVELSLKSVAPVNISGTDFDISILLSSTPSVGQMTLTLDDAAAVSGTFDSFFDVFFDVYLYIAGTEFLWDVYSDLPPLRLESSGTPWVSTPPPGALLVPGPYGDLDANQHPSPGQDFFDFYIAERVIENHPGGGARHEAIPTPIPEPTTLSLLGLGLTGLIIRARKRKA